MTDQTTGGQIIPAGRPAEEHVVEGGVQPQVLKVAPLGLADRHRHAVALEVAHDDHAAVAADHHVVAGEGGPAGGRSPTLGQGVAE